MIGALVVAYMCTLPGIVFGGLTGYFFCLLWRAEWALQGLMVGTALGGLTGLGLAFLWLTR